MTLRMPQPDAAVLARRAEIVRDLNAIVPGEGVISTEREMRPYETDELTAYRQLPFLVVLPETTEQVSRVLRYCHEHGIRVVPRGAGTSLSGGAMPLADGVLLGMGKFNRIRDIDFANRVAVVEPGVTNLAISQAVAHEGFYYAPHPSSQIACTIGAGIIPGGMEMMDRPAIHAVEEFVHAGYPLNVEALLIVELDGPAAEVDHLLERVEAIARDCGSTEVRVSTSEDERLLFWAGRKAAFPAVGRISPDYYCMDGTIPRAKLPLVLKRTRELSEQFGLRVANVFHAGDGNLHPLILYDANNPGELERTEAFGAEILKLCVEVGGVLTGEHGVGVEKRDLMPAMFSEIDLNQQQRVKCAFDAKGLLNPGKVFPTLHRCAELGRMHVHAGRVAFPDIPRF